MSIYPNKTSWYSCRLHWSRSLPTLVLQARLHISNDGKTQGRGGRGHGEASRVGSAIARGGRGRDQVHRWHWHCVQQCLADTKHVTCIHKQIQADSGLSVFCVVWCCLCELLCRSRDMLGSFHRCWQWQGQLERVMGEAGWTNGLREKTKDWPVFKASTSCRQKKGHILGIEKLPPPYVPLWLSDYSGYSPPPWLLATPASCQSTQLMPVSYLLSVFLGASKCDKFEIGEM